MANRHDMVSRTAYKYMLKLHFFDVETRTEIIRYGERITRAGADEVIRTEFLRHKNDGQYILTQVEVQETYRQLYGMTPEAFYNSAQLVESVII